MPIKLEWTEISVRLLLTALAGFLVGLNRGERGRPAGLRTTMLVCLAASISMVEVNLLLGVTGKAPNSFINFDPMRLPLGILSGMGFIGAGAIVRRDDMIRGVTTAATLWFVTVIGLCLGGGQIWLGLAGLVLGLAVLWCLGWFEEETKQDRKATLTLVANSDGPNEQNVYSALAPSGFAVTSGCQAYSDSGKQHELKFEIKWRGLPDDNRPPPAVQDLARRPGVLRLEWKPQ
jgi:putative Mg2+ transporter-C (MgtC) family protein